VTSQETFPGVTGVGVPILTPRGQPLGSIAMGGPLHRMDAKAVARIARLMLDIGRRAAARIAGTPAGAGA